MKNITILLDKVADELEARGLLELAAGVDTASNTIEKTEPFVSTLRRVAMPESISPASFDRLAKDWVTVLEMMKNLASNSVGHYKYLMQKDAEAMNKLDHKALADATQALNAFLDAAMKCDAIKNPNRPK